MQAALIDLVNKIEKRGIEKWGDTDNCPEALLNAATEELGEVAHAINHQEGGARIQQEVVDVIGILSRLYNMVEIQ